MYCQSFAPEHDGSTQTSSAGIGFQLRSPSPPLRVSSQKAFAQAVPMTPPSMKDTPSFMRAFVLPQR